MDQQRGYTVLGSSGFIGSHLAKVLQEQELEVNCPTRTELSALSGNLGHVFYALGVDNVGDDPFGAFDAHVGHLRHILQNCEFHSLTYFSSTRLYLNAPESVEHARLIVDPVDPGRLYNATKIAGEMLCLAAERPQIRVVRISNVVGFAPRGINFIPALIKDALSKREINVTIDPSSSKDYVSLQDAVDLILKVAAAGRSRLYNIGSGVNLTAGEIVAHIERCTGAKAAWQQGAPVVRYAPLAIDRLANEFPFKAMSVLQMLPEICAQFRKSYF